MAEVIVQFDRPVTDAAGRAYDARVCGGVADDGLWEGWIEFGPQEGGMTLRTPRETEQPDRRDLEYWATGLTVAYLEGALRRALRPQTPDLRPVWVNATPAYDRPAPALGNRHRDRVDGHAHAILNPFEVYLQGEDVLREELGALSADHLRNIIRAYRLADAEAMPRLDGDRRAMTETIVDAARRRAG